MVSIRARMQMLDEAGLVTAVDLRLVDVTNKIRRLRMSRLGVQRVGKFLILAMTFVVPALAAEKVGVPPQSDVSASTSAAPEPSSAAESASATADLPTADLEVTEPLAAEAPEAEPATGSAAAATATADTSSQTNPDKKLYVDIYPIFGWIPFFSSNFTVPPLPGGGGGNSIGGSTAFSLNGAAVFALGVRYKKFLFDGEGMFAGVSAKRDSPYVHASTKIDYGDMFIGYDVWKGVYAIAGVRRLAIDFQASVLNAPTFARKPGIWDPLVGVEWRKQLPHKFDVKTRFDIGGFGVGSYVDLDAQALLEWRFFKHFGMALGYQVLYDELKGTVNETILNQTITHNWSYAQTFHGPILGIGIYF
jgi:hypothetical protein